MPANYNPYLQNFQNQYPVYNSFTPGGAVATPIQPARPVMGSNVLGYQVDGEVGAKAYPFQNGSNDPLVLWDMNDSAFYLRSYNPSGFPNPLKRYRFVEEEMPQALPAGMSGNSMAAADMSQMANPAAFLKQRFPDIPDQIMNNPWQIMQYLQQTRGMSQDQIQQMGNQAMPQYQMFQNQFK